MRRLSWAIFAALALSACGSGSDDGDSAGSGQGAGGQGGSSGNQAGGAGGSGKAGSGQAGSGQAGQAGKAGSGQAGASGAGQQGGAGGSGGNQQGGSSGSGASAGSGQGGAGASGGAQGGSSGSGQAGAGQSSDGATMRHGVNYGHRNSNWGDDSDGLLASLVGCDSARLKLPEYHLDKWGYDIEVGDIKSYADHGMDDHIAFLIGPIAAHSTAPAGTPDWQLDEYIPRNLHEPVTLPDGSINPDNYWAAYVFKTVGTYKDHVKYWEVWNEPDWVPDYKITESWETEPPKAADLPRFHGSIFDYVRLLRVTREAAKKADPNAKIALGGVGYPSFLGAILRYTDEPGSGAVDADHPEKGGAYFDVVNFHYYPLYTPGNSEAGAQGFLAQRDAMAAKLSAAGVSGKLWNATETGAPRQSFGGQPGGEAYARNYLLKVMTLAHSSGFVGVDWFSLSDGGKPGEVTDPYALMGLYLDIAGLTATDQAVPSPTGVASATLGKLVGRAKSDPAATAAMALPSGTSGAAFRLADGRRAYVLWAIPPAGSEDAQAEVALPADKPLVRHDWDFSKTGATETLAPQGGKVTLSLDGSPRLFVEP